MLETHATAVGGSPEILMMIGFAAALVLTAGAVLSGGRLRASQSPWVGGAVTLGIAGCAGLGLFMMTGASLDRLFPREATTTGLSHWPVEASLAGPAAATGIAFDPAVAPSLPEIEAEGLAAAATGRHGVIVERRPDVAALQNTPRVAAYHAEDGAISEAAIKDDLAGALADNAVAEAGWAHLRMGESLSERGAQDEAMRHFEEAVMRFTEAGDFTGTARALAQIGLVFQARGDRAAAQAHFDQALEIDRRLGGKIGIAEELRARGLGAPYAAPAQGS